MIGNADPQRTPRGRSFHQTSRDCRGLRRRAGRAIGAIDVVGIECDRGLALFCCTAGRQRLIAEKAAARLQAGAGQAAAAVAIRAAAEELRFGLSSHETVIQRAFAAVEAVSRRMAELQKSGGMKEINKLFAAERLDRAVSRFSVCAKLAMLEAIARQR